ncbi:hypothetical protein GmRootV213_03730 [Variovorax sp. V213]|uniref:hypothetical protein n=1 Tax=Variovorax sp. V213 TaxID=3065955 RepID=UPI0034E83E5F
MGFLSTIFTPQFTQVGFLAAKAKCAAGKNPAAKAKLLEVRAKVRELTHRSAELSSVARWCLQVRNEKQLLKLVA